MCAGGKRVGRKPAFTRDDIIRATFDEGIDTFTLSAVASRVGVVTPALYRLFASRDDIVVACLDTAAASIATPSPGAEWPDVLRMWADECWRICEDYPGINRVVYSFASAMARVAIVLDRYAASLAPHGITQGQAMFALDLIGDTVFTGHLGAHMMRSADQRGTTGLDHVRAALTDAPTAVLPDESWAGRGPTDIKVDFIITGLAVRWPQI